ncbi:hypothetical protein [Eikenella sp. NML120348]|uniref:hypothetical protein n=1 Tax=Eikenella sp. NML120348 TaxID=1795831 RepID=UPI0007E0CA1F|nr:hypothetical protein [Eikenella sp. NML120348]OAM38309.1 hypothetical protein A7P99_03870 [Eikenella sp. NML120348]
MRKLLYGVFIALGLAACGGQEQQAPAVSEPASDAQVQSSYCPPPLGMMAETLLENIDAGLKSTGASARVINKEIVPNECGHDVMMVTDFGGVIIKIDDNQNVLSLAAGYEMTGNTVKDVAHALPAIQVMTSPYGRAKLGELAIGQDLLKALPEVLNAAARQQGEATQDIIRDGYKYSITVENRNVAFVVRKAE